MVLRRWRLPLLGLTVLAAFGVRVLGLGILDLSDDEAFFVQIAHQGTYLQLAGSAEPHPPLYLAMLQGWMLAAGVTEYAVRLLSVVFGVALVAAMYQLGRRIAGERLGLAAAVVAALNPYQIFYSQIARNYEMACLLGVVSFVAFLAALHRPGLLPAYAASVLLAIFSHYYAIAIVLFEQALLVAWLWQRHFKGWQRWLAVDACIAVVFLPWTGYSLRTVVNYEPGHGTPQIVGRALLQTFQFYNFGTAFRPSDIVWPSIAVVAVLGLGVVALARRGRRALGLSLGFQAAPIVLGLVTLVHTTQFGARFLFLGSPGYLLVVAGAIVLLARRWALSLAPLALLGSLAGFAVHNTAFSDQFTDKAYSRLAAYLAQHIGPNETVVLDGISQSLQYWYYGQLRQGVAQPVAIMPLKADGGGADGAPVDTGLTESALDRLAGGSSGIWLIDDDSLRYDPDLYTQRVLAAKHYRAFSRWFRGQKLDYYALGDAGPVANVGVNLDGVTLVGASRLSRATPAGQAIPVALVWQATRDNSPPFKESLRLVAGSGAIVTQDDEPAGQGFWPTAWPMGTSRKENSGLLVPVGTLPGTYSLRLVAYDAASGKALGPGIDLQQVRIDHSAPQRLESADLQPADAVIEGKRLAGLSVPSDVAAGEKLNLSLLWSGGPTSEPEAVPLTFGPVQLVHQIGGGSYPTTDWQPRDVVREEVTIRVPAGVAPGSYPLMAGDVRLATVRVLPPKRLFSPPPVPHAVSARFGEVAQLLGYDAEPSATGLRLRLTWKALSETPVSYTVFVHVLSDDGKIRAQVDVPPGTDNWDAGEFVTTSYDLSVSPDSKLAVGLYDPRTGARLPVCSGASGCAEAADHVELPRLSSQAERPSLRSG